MKRYQVERSPAEVIGVFEIDIKTGALQSFGREPVSIAGLQAPWKQDDPLTEFKLYLIPPNLDLVQKTGFYDGRVMYPSTVKIPTKLPVPEKPFTINKVERSGDSSSTYILDQSFNDATQFFPIGRIVNGSYTVIGITKGTNNKAIVTLAPGGVVSSINLV